MSSKSASERPGMMNVFLDGAKRGVMLWLNSMLPAIVLAFGLIRVFELTGILTVLGKLFGPIMAIFGLPGEAITILVTGWMSIAGGCGAAASLVSNGTLTGKEVTIVLPMIFLMGSQAQFIGRILAVAGATSKRYWVLLSISILNAVLAGLIMRVIV